MAAKSDIEWTDASYTPIRARNLKTGKVGWHCEHATTGCEFCYSEGFNKRLGTGLPFKPGHRGDLDIFLDEEMLLAPLRWKKPRKIFVCSMTDLFADFVKDEWIDKIFAVIALCPQHTFQVLTKRAKRMRQWFANVDRADRVGLAMLTLVDRIPYGHRRVPWPLPNIWLGVSAERQQEADERIPLLLQTPAAVRFVSAEPLLGPISLKNLAKVDLSPSEIQWTNAIAGQRMRRKQSPMFDRNSSAEINLVENTNKLDWVIVGGESGQYARQTDPKWVRWLRDECEDAKTKFFFKQWGAWAYPDQCVVDDLGQLHVATRYDSKVISEPMKVGKKAAGRLLDGKEHNEFPIQTLQPESRTA